MNQTLSKGYGEGLVATMGFGTIGYKIIIIRGRIKEEEDDDDEE